MKVKKAPLVLAAAFFVSGAAYVSLPLGGFPKPLPEAVRSTEPADVETPLRRGYFTDATREQVIAHYKSQFGSLPTFRLNYPPEEAQALIRDQTRSTYLEELVQPGRESVFINGFEPHRDNEAIVVDGKRYEQKIIVRYAPSGLHIRLMVVALSTLLIYALLYQFLS